MKEHGVSVELEPFAVESAEQDMDNVPLLQPVLVQAPSVQVVESSVDLTPDEEQGKCVACCRICLEPDSGESGDELISPCKCKGTQQFVHRSCLDHWRSVKTIIALGALAFLMDSNGQFRNSFSEGWDKILSRHPVPFYYCLGVFIFFVILGIGGLVVHCSSVNNNDPCLAGCRHCCYGWGILDCFPASMEACGALLVIFVIIFAILGVAYGLLAATMALQRIWQRHYHILTKRELTKEYIVEDLHGDYVEPALDLEHEERLRSLKLL